jgi:hypothetical protein
MYRWLRDQAISVWFDRIELRAGDSLLTKIPSSITESNFLLVLMTENSKKSKWVKKEISIALALENRRTGPTLIPVLLQDCKMPKMLAGKKYVLINEAQTDFPEIISGIFRDSYRMDVTLRSDNLELDETILMDHLNEYLRSDYEKVRVFIENHDFNKKVYEIASKSPTIKTKTSAKNIGLLKERIKQKSIWFPVHLPLYWVNLSQLLTQLTSNIFRIRNLNSVYFAFHAINNTIKYCDFRMSSYLLDFPLFPFYAKKLGFHDIANYSTRYLEKFKWSYLAEMETRDSLKKVLADLFDCSIDDLEYVDIISQNPKIKYVNMHLPYISDKLQAPYTLSLSEIITEDSWYRYCVPQIINKVLIETVAGEGKPLHELDYEVGLKIEDYDRIGYH